MIDNIIKKFIELSDSVDVSDYSYGYSLINKNYFSDRRYNGFNQLLLMLLRCYKKYPSRYWATFHQIRKAGGSVNKGEHSITVLFYGTQLILEDNNGNQLIPDDNFSSDEISKHVQDGFSIKHRSTYKFHNLFNFAQTTGLEERLNYESGQEDKNEADAIDTLDNYIIKERISLKDTLQYCEYDILTDTISIPSSQLFDSVHQFAEMLAHESIHSTGHEKRLNRLNTTILKDKENRIVEELIAEFGAMLYLNHFDIFDSDANMVRYIKSYIEEDKEKLTRELFSITTASTKAVNYIIEKSGYKT